MPNERHITIRGPELEVVGQRLAAEVDARYRDLDARIDRLEDRLVALDRINESLVVLLETFATLEGNERLAKHLTNLRRKHSIP